MTTSILQEFKHPKPTLTTDWSNFKLQHPHPKGKYVPVQKAFVTGTKVNTRNLEFYRTRGNEAERLDIRRENYQRRQTQMECHGFNAKKERPYKGIGDPFYLDEDKLILHALGQLEEKEEVVARSSSSDEDDIIKITSKSKDPLRSSVSTPQFRLKRPRKDLHTIQKEVNHNRNVIRNVRLGHGLFDIIKQEQNYKQAAIEEQLRLKAERMRTEWQPPKQDSSSDEETDNELEEDVDLSSEAEESRSYMNQEVRESEDDIDDDADSDASPEPRDKAVVSSVSFREEVDSSPLYGNKHLLTMPRPHTSASVKKKKQKIPRPYTPHFVNIMEESKENSGPSDGLFRQLSALYWVLEAMRNCDDSGIKMTPIMSCWKLKQLREGLIRLDSGELRNIGGVPTIEDVAIRDKEIEKDWKKFREQDSHGAHRDRFNSRLYLQRRGTGSPKKSTSPWRSSLAGSIMGMSSAMRSSVEDDDHGDDDKEEEESPTKRASRMSVDLNGSKAESEAATKTDESIDKQEDAVVERWKQEQMRIAEEKQKLAKTASELKRSAKVAKIEQLVKQSLNQTEPMKGRQDRADVHFIRPKSSPQLVAFKANRYSVKHGDMANKINTEFRRLQEEKALLLHEELEHREKQRMMICQNKFIAINNQKTTSFHKALKQMRERSDKLFSRPTDEQMKKKQQEEQGNWLTDLLRNIPDDLKKQWHYKQIIDKFNNRFGSPTRSSQRRATVVQIEGFGQQHSKIKFLKVLERLREWEICSPDISAAIEFCREKIVKMPVEQFEEWFHSHFPKVVRPQTAPPVKKEEKKEDNSVKRQNSSTSLAVPRRGASAYRKLVRPMTTG